MFHDTLPGTVAVLFEMYTGSAPVLTIRPAVRVQHGARDFSEFGNTPSQSTQSRNML